MYYYYYYCIPTDFKTERTNPKIVLQNLGGEDIASQGGGHQGDHVGHGKSSGAELDACNNKGGTKEGCVF